MGQSVVELQKRDLAMLGSLLCWELLPAWYLAAWYFAGSKRTAENRLGLLRRAGYLRRVETWWRGLLVVAPTERGRAARPDLCLGTPELAESTRLKHRLEVVRVADHLPRADAQAGSPSDSRGTPRCATRARRPGGPGAGARTGC